MDPGFENQPADAECPSRDLELVQQRATQSLPAQVGFDVHPLHLSRRRVEHSERTATDRATALAGHEEGAPPAGKLLRLQVGSEALLGDVELGQSGVKGADQPLGVR